MKVLKKRITKENRDEAIAYCKDYSAKNPQSWKKNHTGYMYAAWLMEMIDKEKMIIHIYTDNTYEFKRIRKKSKKETNEKRGNKSSKV